MKKLLTLASLVLALIIVGCSYDDSGIISRLENLENQNMSNIATLQQQIDAINATLPELKVVDAELKEYITALQEADENFNSVIASLQEKQNQLSGSIATLEHYVDSELDGYMDWVTATFATLEQYNTLATLLALLDEYVKNLEIEINSDITTSITNLESSMKGWVNEQLTSYYTIAEVDASLELLEKIVTDGDAALMAEINKLSERIDTMKTTITEAYQLAITAAITENNGVIDTKIANEIATINSRIDSETANINSRIDTLEARIEALEDIINKIQALNIEFDNTDGLVCYPGASVEVGYTIVDGDAETAIECFGDGGWSASIIKESDTAGKIKVTAPNDATSGKVVVLATSGVGGSVMKSLYFDEGILTNILDTYEVDWEACTLNVTLTTNLDYTINIPVDWITVADTRAALREETLTFTIAENYNITPRTATIELIGACGDVLQSFAITQNIQQGECEIVLTDITSTSVKIKTIPHGNVVEYYVYVRDKAWSDSIVAGYGESMLATLVAYPSAGSWNFTDTNEGIWDDLNPNTEYICHFLAIYNNGTQALSLVPFKTLEPSGAAPTIDADLTPAQENGHYTLNLNIFCAEAATVKYAFNTKADVESVRTQYNYSDSDIARIYGMELNAEQVEAIRTTGLTLPRENLYPGVEYEAVISIKNSEKTETTISVTANTLAKPVPARVESGLFTSFLGEWEVSYSLTQFNGVAVTINNAVVTIAAGTDANSADYYRSHNRLVVQGWPFNVWGDGNHDPMPYYSPADHKEAKSYWANNPQLAERDCGPKIFFEIAEGDVVTVPSSKSDYFCNWDDDSTLLFFGADATNGWTAPATFPVTISADGDTITIGASEPVEQFGNGIYRPAVFRYGTEPWAIATSDIVLKRVK